MPPRKNASEPAELETLDADDGDENEDQTEGQVSGGFNAEAQHMTAIERMTAMADELVLDDKSLVFDVRDFLLDTIKARPKPWSATSQAEQREVAASCEHTAKELVRRIVEAVAARGTDPVRVLLTKVALGDDMVITGKVKTFSDEEADRAVMQLHHARGKHVLLTVASVEDYSEENREAATEPDEPGFGFEAGDGDE